MRLLGFLVAFVLGTSCGGINDPSGSSNPLPDMTPCLHGCIGSQDCGGGEYCLKGCCVSTGPGDLAKPAPDMTQPTDPDMSLICDPPCPMGWLCTEAGCVPESIDPPDLTMGPLDPPDLR